jgi:hypothetical protein
MLICARGPEQKRCDGSPPHHERLRLGGEPFIVDAPSVLGVSSAYQQGPRSGKLLIDGKQHRITLYARQAPES